MENTDLTQEYCSRLGLRVANGDKHKALHIAEERYKALVDREVSCEEIRSLQLLIDEIASWTASKSFVISAA